MALSDLGFERVTLLVGTDQENLCFRLGSGQPIRQAQEDAIPKFPKELGIFGALLSLKFSDGSENRFS